MEDWLDRYAGALGMPPLTDEERTELLALARDVAHGSERRFAPLATFLAGALTAHRTNGERGAAIRDAVEAATSLLADEEPDEGRTVAGT